MNLPTPDTYSDLEIRIRKLEADRYPVEITFRDQQEFAPGYLDSQVVPRVERACWPEEQGPVLFEHLFCDENLRSAWDRARDTDLRLRLRLDDSAPELHALPWETLCDAATGSLAATAATPFSRYLACDQEHGEPVRERPVRLVAAIASPEDLEEYHLPELDVEAERRALETAVAEAVKARQLELHFIDPPVSPERIDEELRRIRPHVLHFVGHGKFNDNGSVVYMENGQRRVRAVEEKELADLMRRQDPCLRLVYLSSCEGARRSSADAFRGFAPRLVAAGVPAVLAMQGQPDIETARELSHTFYRQLLDHGMVDLALNEARAAALAGRRKGVSYPVLFMRLKDGLLFCPENQRLPGLDLETYREHKRASLEKDARRHVSLAAHEVVIDGRRREKVPESFAALTDHVERHDRVLLLGAAGAGKTSSLELLTRSCLEGGLASLPGARPLYLELSRLRAHDGGPAEEGLLTLTAETLYQDRAFSEPPSPALVRSLLEEGPPWLILLDGLNELPEAIRHRARQAIEDLADRYDRHRYVLTTRPHGVTPIEGWTTLELSPLDDERIRELVSRATDDATAEDLLETVSDAHRSLLRLPLFLGFLVELRHKKQRLHQKIGSTSALLQAYVDELLLRDDGGGFADEEQLLTALVTLAEASQTHGQSLLGSEAEAALQSALPDLSQAAASGFLENLCKRGFLVADHNYVRFWHPTLQEYFLAGAAVERWRDGRGKITSSAPRELRRQLSRSQAEEAFDLAVAHLRDEELDPALRSVLWLNPRLALSWADDLSLAERAPESLAGFLEEVHRFTRLARRYSGAGLTRRTALLMLLLPILVGTGLGLAFSTYSPLLGLSIAVLTWAPLVDLARCPPAFRLRDLLLAIPGLRHPGLRQRLQIVAAGVAHSWVLAKKSLRETAAAAIDLDTLDFEEVVQVIESHSRQSTRITAVGQLERISDPRVVPFLGLLLSARSELSRPAMKVLERRIERYPEETELVRELTSKVLDTRHGDYACRIKAYKTLKMLGESPEIRRLVDRHFVVDAAKKLLKGFLLILFIETFSGPVGLVLALLNRPLSFRKALLVIAFMSWGHLLILMEFVAAPPGVPQLSGGDLVYGIFLLAVAGLLARDLQLGGLKWERPKGKRSLSLGPFVGVLVLLLGASLWTQTRGGYNWNQILTDSSSPVPAPLLLAYFWLALLASVYILYRHEFVTGPRPVSEVSSIAVEIKGVRHRESLNM